MILYNYLLYSINNKNRKGKKMLKISWYDCDGKYENSEKVKSLEEAQARHPFGDFTDYPEKRLIIIECPTSGEIGRLRY